MRPHGGLPHLVEEQGPALGRLDAPTTTSRDAGMRSPLAARQDGPVEIAESGGALHGDELPRAAAAQAVDLPRHGLLPAAALPFDENRRVDVRGGRDPRAQGPHGRGVADKEVTAFHPLRKLRVLEPEVALLQRPGPDRGIDGAARRDHDHGERRRRLAHPPENRQLVPPRKLDDKQHRVDRVARHDFQRRFAIFGRNGPVPLIRQDLFEGLPKTLVGTGHHDGPHRAL
jgi:hypothetical protein